MHIVDLQNSLHSLLTGWSEKCRIICIVTGCRECIFEGVLDATVHRGRNGSHADPLEICELKPPEIQERFSRPIKNAALRSYLTILCTKGHISRRRKGNAYYYRAKTSANRPSAPCSVRLVNTFCDGSMEALLCQLLAKEKFSPEELLNLQRIAQRESTVTDPPRRTEP